VLRFFVEKYVLHSIHDQPILDMGMHSQRISIGKIKMSLSFYSIHA